MAACVAKADPFCLDMPLKVETVARAPSPQQSSMARVRMGSALAGMPGSPRLARLNSGSPCASPHSDRLRLRTASSLGMPINPYLHGGGGDLSPRIPEGLCLNDLLSVADPRERFRTASSMGMPISPWQYNGGLGVQQAQPESQYAPVLISASAPGAYAAGVPAYSGDAWASGGQPQLPVQLKPAPGSFLTAAPLPKEPAQVQKPILVEGSSATSTSETACTTVMLRDLPEGLTRDNLLELLDSQGFSGRYDFVYLPINFDKMTSLTHAFLNFVSAEDAAQVHERFEGFSDWAVPCPSRCRVVWNDKHQGLASLAERYRNSPVMHESVPDECKPIIIIDGRRVQFPPASQKIKLPKNFRPKM